ncbi:MAG TPA: hypothetical protein VII23_23255 [Terriglobales bacterium]
MIDASDLNRPIARLVWLGPMLELERAILDAVRHLKIDDDRQYKALGRAGADTRKKQKKAQQHDLGMPLLEYAAFPSLLHASVRLEIDQLSDSEIAELNCVRKRAAHGAGGAIISDRRDCERVNRALEIAGGAERTITRRFALKSR